MLKRFAIAAVAAVAVSSNSIAGGFDGAFVQAGMGVVKAKADVSFKNWFDAQIRDDNWESQVSVGYSWSFGRFNMAASAYYLPGKQNAGQTMQQYDPTEIDRVSLKLRHGWGVSIEPGINLNESTLVYAKMGVGLSKGEWLFERPKFQDSYSGKTSFRGFSLGFGAKHKFTRNFYGFAEIQHTRFGRKSVTMAVDGNNYTDAFKPELLTGLIGVGYKF